MDFLTLLPYMGILILVVINVFLVSMLTYIVVSLMAKNRRPDAEHLEVVFGRNSSS